MRSPAKAEAVRGGHTVLDRLAFEASAAMQSSRMRHLAWFLELAFFAVAVTLLSHPSLGQGVSDLDLSIRASDYAPSVTLQTHENRVTEEYRVNGRLYMIKVTPKVGAPYYLVDENGSGDMAMSRGFDGIEQRTPQWTLLTW